MKKILIFVFLLSNLAPSARASGWTPSGALLQAVRSVESSNGRYVYGDNGKSLGSFQLSQGAWADVNEARKAKKLKIYDYQENVFNAYINRVYAAQYLSLLHDQLEHEIKKEPTPQQLYAAYNMGLSGFAECNYDLRRINRVTAQRCQQVAQLTKTK